ncbi:MAG: cadherin-like domain-containing protein, partial [Actinobacteria bacterium]|nr:cadherin-like domain-containing protein [Actinomycetota bacterium]
TDSTPLTVGAPGVLANDTDADGGILTAGSASNPPGGSVTLNANGSFTYTPDAGFSGTDSFTYTVTDNHGATDTATVTVTVVLNTYLAISDASVTEGNSGPTTANFTVTRSGKTTGTSSVQYKTTNGTAAAGSDFTGIPTNLTLNFAAGETSKTVGVTVTGDTLAEKNETFNVLLSGATGATISDTAGVGTIINDDGWGTLTYLSVNDVVITEGNAGTVAANFTITRTGNTAGSSTVSYKTTDGTATVAGGDYTAIALTPVTFAAGETTKPVSVSVTGDVVDEVNEAFTVNLSAPVGAVITDTAGTGTIVDDDGAITAGPTTFYSLTDVSVTEGNAGTAVATFTVSRSGNTAAAGSVKYATANSTAIAPGDYTAKPLTILSFAAGETSKQVTVNVIGETVAELDETFRLNLSAPVGGVISDSSGTATIVNDDFAYYSVNDVSVNEGDAGTKVAIFTVTRSGSLTGPGSVKYKTTDVSAVAPGDYTAVALTQVNFAAGETSKQVTVNVIGDTVAEVDETFRVDLSVAVGGVIADTQGMGTITNDD